MKYNVPTGLIELVAKHMEGGKPGMKNSNTNGSFDMGVMQINSIHLKELSQYGIDEDSLVNDVCTNIDVGTFLLAREIKRAGSFAKGLSHYHSRTEKHAKKYLSRALNHLESINE